MEKKQVSTFLKILQIPTNAPADDIKQSLLDSGWNESDANEAVQILHPNEKSSETKSANFTPQLVAQKYVRSTNADNDTPDAVSPTNTASGVSDTHESIENPDHSKAVVSPLKKSVMHESASIKENASEESASSDEVSRPHTDAPWLKDPVDIYDVSEEEKQRMIRTVYRTNERLTPQTIHALLGIDVDLSEYEAAYEGERKSFFGWSQFFTIFVISVILAAVGVYFSLYYFEVGPFHPSLTGNV